MYYLSIGFFLAIVTCIMYLKYGVRYSGAISYILIVILCGIGISLTITSVKQFRTDKKKWLLFQNTEGVFINSKEVTERESVTYKYRYEYYVNGKRYEFTDRVMHFSKIPEKKDKNLTVRYNPKNPEEISMIDKEYIVSFLNGPISIVFSLLLLFILLVTKK